MLNEQEKQMAMDAAHCDDCLGWHKHCKAECCSVVFLNAPASEVMSKGRYIRIQGHLSLGNRKYYRLRGVRYVHGILLFEKSMCKPHGNRIIYIRPCDWLTDKLLCKGHPDDKPELCKVLTLDTANDPKMGFEITPNCLFRFKVKGVEIDENEKE